MKPVSHVLERRRLLEPKNTIRTTAVSRISRYAGFAQEIMERYLGRGAYELSSASFVLFQWGGGEGKEKQAFGKELVKQLRMVEKLHEKKTVPAIYRQVILQLKNTLRLYEAAPGKTDRELLTLCRETLRESREKETSFWLEKERAVFREERKEGPERLQFLEKIAERIYREEAAESREKRPASIGSFSFAMENMAKQSGSLAGYRERWALFKERSARQYYEVNRYRMPYVRLFFGMSGREKEIFRELFPAYFPKGVEPGQVILSMNHETWTKWQREVIFLLSEGKKPGSRRSFSRRLGLERQKPAAKRDGRMRFGRAIGPGTVESWNKSPGPGALEYLGAAEGTVSLENRNALTGPGNLENWNALTGPGTVESWNALTGPGFLEYLDAAENGQWMWTPVEPEEKNEVNPGPEDSEGDSWTRPWELSEADREALVSFIRSLDAEQWEAVDRALETPVENGTVRLHWMERLKEEYRYRREEKVSNEKKERGRRQKPGEKPSHPGKQSLMELVRENGRAAYALAELFYEMPQLSLYREGKKETVEAERRNQTESRREVEKRDRTEIWRELENRNQTEINRETEAWNQMEIRRELENRLRREVDSQEQAESRQERERLNQPQNQTESRQELKAQEQTESLQKTEPQREAVAELIQSLEPEEWRFLETALLGESQDGSPEREALRETYVLRKEAFFKEIEKDHPDLPGEAMEVLGKMPLLELLEETDGAAKAVEELIYRVPQLSLYQTKQEEMRMPESRQDADRMKEGTTPLPSLEASVEVLSELIQSLDGQEWASVEKALEDTGNGDAPERQLQREYVLRKEEFLKHLERENPALPPEARAAIGKLPLLQMIEEAPALASEAAGLFSRLPELALYTEGWKRTESGASSRGMTGEPLERVEGTQSETETLHSQTETLEKLESVSMQFDSLREQIQKTGEAERKDRPLLPESSLGERLKKAVEKSREMVTESIRSMEEETWNQVEQILLRPEEPFYREYQEYRDSQKYQNNQEYKSNPNYQEYKDNQADRNAGNGPENQRPKEAVDQRREPLLHLVQENRLAAQYLTEVLEELPAPAEKGLELLKNSREGFLKLLERETVPGRENRQAEQGQPELRQLESGKAELRQLEIGQPELRQLEIEKSELRQMENSKLGEPGKPGEPGKARKPGEPGESNERGRVPGEPDLSHPESMNVPDLSHPATSGQSEPTRPAPDRPKPPQLFSSMGQSGIRSAETVWQKEAGKDPWERQQNGQGEGQQNIWWNGPREYDQNPWQNSGQAIQWPPRQNGPTRETGRSGSNSGRAGTFAPEALSYGPASMVTVRPLPPRQAPPPEPRTDILFKKDGGEEAPEGDIRTLQLPGLKTTAAVEYEETLRTINEQLEIQKKQVEELLKRPYPPEDSEQLGRVLEKMLKKLQRQKKLERMQRGAN